MVDAVDRDSAGSVLSAESSRLQWDPSAWVQITFLCCWPEEEEKKMAESLFCLPDHDRPVSSSFSLDWTGLVMMHSMHPNIWLERFWCRIVMIRLLPSSLESVESTRAELNTYVPIEFELSQWKWEVAGDLLFCREKGPPGLKVPHRPNGIQQQQQPNLKAVAESIKQNWKMSSPFRLHQCPAKQIFFLLQLFWFPCLTLPLLLTSSPPLMFLPPLFTHFFYSKLIPSADIRKKKGSKNLCPSECTFISCNITNDFAVLQYYCSLLYSITWGRLLHSNFFIWIKFFLSSSSFFYFLQIHAEFHIQKGERNGIFPPFQTTRKYYFLWISWWWRWCGFQSVVMMMTADRKTDPFAQNSRIMLS